MNESEEQTSSGGEDALPDTGSENFKPDEFTESREASSTDAPDVNINVILDVDVDLALEVGRATLSVRNLLQLNQGSVVELDRAAGEPLDVLVNGTLVARGEVVVVNENFGIRLTEIVTPLERVQKLS